MADAGNASLPGTENGGRLFDLAFINYAHRGASAYAPENTLASFYLGWQMGANGIETDVQRSADGVLVLFHDDNLMRIAGLPMAIHDLTYAELLALDLGKGKDEKYAGERIPTLEEFLRHFGGKELHFAIEIKEEGVEAETLEMIRRYGCRERIIITSGIWRALQTVHALEPDMPLGYLAKSLNPALLEEAKKNGIGQICPKASILTEEWNRTLREAGFSVRAWGIDSSETMRRMLAMKVDGMTIDFPDVLVSELKAMGVA